MGKNKGLGFLTFSVLGALAGYVSYMACNDKFSDETKDKYGNVVSKMKNVGTDIKRTYTSIGDKNSFTANSKNLGNSAKKLAEKTGTLVASASSDMYKYAKGLVNKAVENVMDEDSQIFDDLDENYVKKIKKFKDDITKKVKKATTKKNACQKK